MEVNSLAKEKQTHEMQERKKAELHPYLLEEE
jgi:hypothetical protein